MRSIGRSVAPACGPAAVTNAPVVTRTRHATTATVASWAGLVHTGPASGTPRPLATAWNVTQAATATTAIASRKWDMTSQGFRSKAPVTAPSGTCATVPAAAATAPHATLRRIPGVRNPIQAVATAASMAIPEITRFENSITAWYPVLGT